LPNCRLRKISRAGASIFWPRPSAIWATDAKSSGQANQRVNDGPEVGAERAEREPRRRLPTDAVNNVVSAVAGGAITDLAYHPKELPPEYAGLGTSGLTVAAGAIAVWRERRKANGDADHRPGG
jgi:hypothetical protein